MNETIGKFLRRCTGKPDSEPLGEDMAPSPDALAERTALSLSTSKSAAQKSPGPFRTAVRAPVRDFIG